MTPYYIIIACIIKNTGVYVDINKYMKMEIKKPNSCRRILIISRPSPSVSKGENVDYSHKLPSKEYTTKGKARKSTITIEKSDNISWVTRFSINKSKLIVSVNL